MPRPFAYNPSHTPIFGTNQIGNLAIGVSPQDYSVILVVYNGGIGPDESSGYIICEPVPAGNFPTPLGNIGTVKFWKSNGLTSEKFIETTNIVFNQSFNTGDNAKTWLNTQGYWTSWQNTYNFSSIPLAWPSTSNYSVYTGNISNIDDGHNETSITIPAFSINGTLSTNLYICTNSYITIGTYGTDIILNSPSQSSPAVICGNPGENWLDKGQPLSDGDIQNIWTQSSSDDSFSQTKILVFSAVYGASTPSSYIINLYRDSNYQWIETRAKSNTYGSAGPYNIINVSSASSTTSKVWRGDLNGQNWLYMGTGSVVR